MRGLFSAGVIDLLMEHELYPDGLIGVSAGAAFGCNMKSRQPGRCIRYNKRFAHDWRYCSLRSLITTGDIFGGEYCYHYVPTHLDIFDTRSFDENPMRFYAVCTDVETGEPVYQRLDRCDEEALEWIRASASMPVASRIVRIGGRKLLDGGIADSIPLRQSQQLGYLRNIVVLTQPRDFVKKPSGMNPLIRWWLRRYPRFVRAALDRHLMYNEELDYIRRQEQLGQTLVIAPAAPLPIGHICHDTDMMQRVYDEGRRQAEAQLDDIKRFFEP